MATSCPAKLKALTTVGGLLAKTWDGNGALAAVVMCYASAFTMVLLFFKKHVIDAQPSKED